MKVIILKPATDAKGGDRIISRLLIDRKVDILIEKEDNIFKRIEEKLLTSSKVNCILVDEVQFMKSSQIDQLFEIAVKLDIPVICYGLRTDFRMEGFEGSERLLLIAHSIEEMKTICKCGNKAMVNARKVNGEFVFKGEQIAIDNVDDVEYESVCGKCYYKYKDRKS